jgi:SNF2 family DNA or RNA helicase
MDYVYNLKEVQARLMNVVILGVKNIQKVNIRTIKNNVAWTQGNYETKEIWVLDTVGSNLLDLLGHEGIDPTRTFSNDIKETYDILGVEAARESIYSELKEVIEFDISPRLSALSEVIAETINKILVFVPYRHTIRVVHNYLTKEGISNEVINGEVSATDRAHIIQRFQSMDDPRVLVIQPQAASHGVTLTRADTIVFWSPVMGVETYLQCVARMDRVGQKNKMTVVHLEGSDVEKRIYKMLQGKIDHHIKLVDLYKEEFNDA